MPNQAISAPASDWPGSRDRGTERDATSLKRTLIDGSGSAYVNTISACSLVPYLPIVDVALEKWLVTQMAVTRKQFQLEERERASAGAALYLLTRAATKHVTIYD